ncbi:hypothetical protein EX30DRAFT_312329 [Ascodesmis nigricans]|uniref:SUI1 domain-containing protein n=1 Tax=Ascodesmis nigricans TaxID=341454 RepID=A0A4S2MMY6_9PEZI|nr:hypothetical protein EX30DRAFT_312329 [Ascodesmis nigricans]
MNDRHNVTTIPQAAPLSVRPPSSSSSRPPPPRHVQEETHRSSTSPLCRIYPLTAQQVKPVSSVRSSDRRKLADTLINTLSIPVPSSPETDSSSGIANLRTSLLPPTTQAAKFSTTHGPDLTPVHGTIYVGSPIPSQDTRASWISLSLPKKLNYTTAPISPNKDVFFPTIYTLWRIPGLLPVVRTHDPVIEKLLGGADLMIPGLVGPPWTEAKVGDIVAVEGGRKGVAMAVGILEVDLKEVERVQGERGRAVKILHWWGDEVWNMGSGEEVPAPDGVAQAVEGVEALKVEEAVGGEVPAGESEVKKEEGEAQDDGTEAIRDLTTKEIDEAFHKAALFGLSTQASKASEINFPLSSSAFLSDFVLPFLPPASSFPPFNLLQSTGPHPSLTLKKSSFKNATKFLKHLDKEQLIKTKTRGGGELVILDCNWQSESVTAFVPYKLPKPEVTPVSAASGNAQAAASADDGEHKPKIKTSKLFYLPGPKLTPFFDEIGADKSKPYTPAELRALLLSHLAAHKTPRIPPSASPTLFTLLSLRSPTSREALLSSFTGLCNPVHTFPDSANPTKLHKGPPPKITITVEKRQGQKSVTRLGGIEELGIEPKWLAEKLSHRCAGAATVKQAVGKKVGVMEVQVQGRWDAVVRGMMEGWGVEGRCVEVVDKTGGKKK